MYDIDVVTVYHNQKNEKQAQDLENAIEMFEPGRCNVIKHSNREENLGFAKGCNIGARQGTAPVIGFINPDAEVQGKFVDHVLYALREEGVMITGKRFEKSDFELGLWGVKNWVCGAVFFVDRAWFESLDGFDERYEWSHEETDFIRMTEKSGYRVQDIELPIYHNSPGDDSEVDSHYKQKKFDEAETEFVKKWGRSW